MRFFVFILVLFTLSLAHAESRDIKVLHESLKRMDSLLRYYRTEIKDLLDLYEVQDNVVLSNDERIKLDQFWTQFVDIRITLHTLYSTHQGERSFYESKLLRYSSNLYLQYSAAVLSYDLWDNKNARKKLDEMNMNQIPRGSFINLENELFRSINKLSKAMVTNIPTMFPVYQFLPDKESFTKIKSIKMGKDELALEIERMDSETEKRMNSYLGFVKNRANLSTVKRRFIAYKFKNLFYTFMTKISTWIGDTKIKNRDPDYYNGQTLIDIKLAKQMEAKVIPGDLMISRTDWFLSNMFLPGFWKHSFIYLGSLQKFKKYFNDSQVNSYYFSKCTQQFLACTDFFSYLKVSSFTKKAWKNFDAKDKYGFDNALLEATSDGVHFSSIRSTFLNDNLAALRPKISKLSKAISIETAFSYYGFAYDFNFDYTTDDTLVCSELVGKSYRHSQGKPEAIEMNYNIDKSQYLSITLGRLALPVVNFVYKMYDENILHLRSKQFDLVAFLKGDSKKKSAYFATEKEFYNTRGWKKWDFMN